MAEAKYVSTYDQIREGKISTMKNIFCSLNGFEKCASAFAEEELVKTFDFFSQHAEKEDTETADIGMWQDFFEASENFLAKKSYKILQKCG